MILFTFYVAIKTEAFTSDREQFTCSDVIPTCHIKMLTWLRVFNHYVNLYHSPQSFFVRWQCACESVNEQGASIFL